MKTFCFLYEDGTGALCEWSCSALCRYDAFDMAKQENPDIVDCCIECNEV